MHRTVYFKGDSAVNESLATAVARAGTRLFLRRRFGAEAAELRAVGRAKSARIAAEADRQKVEMVANAQKEAEIIRGQGDAERNAVFAKAFGKDKDFFAFYRSMKAYEESLTRGSTLVVEPKSEFFRYFGNSTESPLKGREERQQQ